MGEGDGHDRWQFLQPGKISFQFSQFTTCATAYTMGGSGSG